MILIAFCFGAFFEGAAGFGTPVAVSGGDPDQLGSNPGCLWPLSHWQYRPGRFGALGTPDPGLKTVTDLDLA